MLYRIPCFPSPSNLEFPATREFVLILVLKTPELCCHGTQINTNQVTSAANSSYNCFRRTALPFLCFVALFPKRNIEHTALSH